MRGTAIAVVVFAAAACTPVRPRIAATIRATELSVTKDGREFLAARGRCREGTRAPIAEKELISIAASIRAQNPAELKLAVAPAADATADAIAEAVGPSITIARAEAEPSPDGTTCSSFAEAYAREHKCCTETKASSASQPDAADVAGTGNKAEGSAEVSGTLTKTEIADVIRASLMRFKTCYDRGLDHDPKIAGIVQVHFLIDPAGAVDRIEVLTNSVDAQVGRCVADVMRKLQFPKPRGGGIVEVTYPFVYATMDR